MQQLQDEGVTSKYLEMNAEKVAGCCSRTLRITVPHTASELDRLLGAVTAAEALDIRINDIQCFQPLADPKVSILGISERVFGHIQGFPWFRFYLLVLSRE